MEIKEQVTGFSFEERLSRSKGRLSRSRVANARVTEVELGELETAAEYEGKALSEWSRETLLKEARPKEDALFTKVIAMRMLLLSLMKPLLLGQKLVPENIVEMLAAVKKDKRQAAKDVAQQWARSRFHNFRSHVLSASKTVFSC